MRKTIKNVMTVVPVLITSCHVSLNWNSGPVTSQTRITPTATMKVAGLPVTRAVAFAKRVNCERDFVGRIDLLSVKGQTSSGNLLTPERPARNQDRPTCGVSTSASTHGVPSVRVYGQSSFQGDRVHFQ